MGTCYSTPDQVLNTLTHKQRGYVESFVNQYDNTYTLQR